jgi:hypothetical protein
MDIYISLHFYPRQRIMYHTLEDIETYVNPYPLTGITQFDVKCIDGILLNCNMCGGKGPETALERPTFISLRGCLSGL